MEPKNPPKKLTKTWDYEKDRMENNVITREMFYNDRKKERVIDFCADIRVIRYFFLRHYKLTQGEFETLLKLDSMGKFITDDFKRLKSRMTWDKHRWKRFRKDEKWVKVWRERDRRQRMYNIYTTSYECKRMVNRFYKMLCGEESIPTDKYINPIMKRESYADNVYANAIEEFNEALRQKRLKKEQYGS